MMLPAQGPTSSLMEDLGDLGLIEGKSENLAEAKNSEPSAKSNAKGSGYAQTDAKGGDYAGPNDGKEGPHYKEGDYMVDAGDTAAGSRFNVPVRSGGLDRSEVGPSASNPAKAEDEYYEGDTVVEGSQKMVPNFLVPTEEEVAEAEEEDAALAEERMLESAWETVNAYFSEDEDGLNEAGLRGVINAMGYALNVAVEDIANLSSENYRLSEAVDELTGLLHEAESCPDEDEDDGKKKGKKLPPWMKKKDDDYDDEVEESRAYSANLTESYDDSSLLDELRNLGEDRAIQAVDTQSKLIEGFETCASACREIVDRIVDVMAEDQGVSEAEDLVIDDEDERVQLAQFFESIADDADAYLARLSDGDVPFRVAEADLNKLYGDMERGIEQMHTAE